MNYKSIKVNADLYQDIVLENISIIVAIKVTTMKLATQPQICKIRTYLHGFVMISKHK